MADYNTRGRGCSKASARTAIESPTGFAGAFIVLAYVVQVSTGGKLYRDEDDNYPSQIAVHRFVSV